MVTQANPNASLIDLVDLALLECDDPSATANELRSCRRMLNQCSIGSMATALADAQDALCCIPNFWRDGRDTSAALARICRLVDALKARVYG